MKNKQIYIDLCKKYNLAEEPTSEVLRIGTTFTDPAYYKQYRIMTMEQLELAIHYFTTINEKDWKKEFTGQENAISVPFIDQNWKGVLIKNKYSKKIIQFAKIHNHSIEVNTGVCHFVTCLLETYY